MTHTAALVAGWGQAQGRRASWVPPSGSAGSPPIQGASDPIGLKVELLMGAQGWVDVSPYVYYRDRIRVQRGRSNETSQTPPQTAGLTLNNRGGRFTPRLPTGPYYKLIGRNTPVRVSRTWNGSRFYRYAGEVPSWPTTSDISGRDVYEQINAAGVLRRLAQGSAPLRSPMERAYTQGVTSSLVTAYWPCEDGPSSASFASGLSGGTPMQYSGTPQLAQNASFVSSAPVPTLNGSSWSAPVPLSTGVVAANVLRFLLAVPSGGDTDTAVLARMYTAGTVARIDVQYSNSFSGSLQLSGFDAFGNSLFATGYGFENLLGRSMRISVELLQSGGNITCALVAMLPGQRASVFSVSIAGSVGAATSIAVNPNGGLTGTAVGHISYQPVWDTLYDLALPLNAWLGEPPDAVQPNDTFQLVGGLQALPNSRFTRLCLENNITPVVVSSAAGFDTDAGPASPTGMGYQTIDTLSALLQQVAETTAGIMFEPRDQVGIGIRTRASLYNQTPRLTLDHSRHQLSAPLNPVDDDQQVRNDVIVQRINGCSASLTQTTGPLSTQAPPNGVGDYQTQYQLSLGADTMLADAAGWRLHLGTVNEPRYPQISLNLRHPTFTGNVDMMNAALSLDIGDRIVIVNPPPELPPDPISLIVQGYTETLGIYEHDMVINCSPESPYEIAILEDPVLGHADTDGSTLSAPIQGSDVTFTVATTGAATGSPLWTTNGADFPFDVNVGGERMTVPSITGGSSPQFFTNVIRAVNGTPIPLGADGTFETGITGWTPTGGTFAASTVRAHSGTTSGLMTVTGSPSQTFVRTPFIPVTPGTAIAATQWVLTASGSPNCLCVIDFFDAGQNYQSSYASNASSAPSAWTVQQSVAVVPDGIAYAQIGPTVNGSPPAGTAIYVDDVTLTSPMPHPAGTDVRLWQPMILSL